MTLKITEADWEWLKSYATYHFLLVVCSNHFYILNRFRDINSFLVNVTIVALNSRLRHLKLQSVYDFLFVTKRIVANIRCSYDMFVI